MKALPREGQGTAENPFPPYNVPHTPFRHPQGGLLSITLYFSNAGNASAAIFWWFLASAVVLRKGSPASAGASGCVAHCMGGRGFSAVSSPSLGDAFVLRSSLLPTCGFHASFQTWPCHALIPHQVSPPRLGPATF